MCHTSTTIPNNPVQAGTPSGVSAYLSEVSVRKLSIAFLAAFVGLCGLTSAKAAVTATPHVDYSVANQTTPYYFQIYTNFTASWAFTNIYDFPWRVCSITAVYGDVATNTLSYTVQKRYAVDAYAPDVVFTNAFGNIATNFNSIQKTGTTYNTVSVPLLSSATTNVTASVIDADVYQFGKFYVLKPDIVQFSNSNTNVATTLIIQGAR
jgi:hypothetical protein